MVVFATLAVLLLLWQFSDAIVLFLLSLAIAAALRPFINGVTGKNISKPLALGIVYFFLVASIIGSLWVIGPSFLKEAETATNDFVANYDIAKTNWPERGTIFQQALAEQLPPSADLFKAITSAQGMPVVSGVFGVAQNFFTLLGRIGIAIILSLYWSADQLRFQRLGLSLLPDKYHPKALHIWQSIESGVGAYLRSEVIQSVLAGILLWLIYGALGLRYPVILALWGAIARLIPWFGAVIAILPVLLIAIGSSPSLGLAAVIFTAAVLILLNDVIEPRVFHRHKYSSLLIVLSVIGLADAFGFAGMILAPPFAVAVQIMFRQLYPFPTPVFSQEISEKLANLRTRIIEVKKRTYRRTNRKSRLVINRMYHLVKMTADYLQQEY